MMFKINLILPAFHSSSSPFLFDFGFIEIDVIFFVNCSSPGVFKLVFELNSDIPPKHNPNKKQLKQNTTQTNPNSNKTQHKQNTTQTKHNSNKTQLKQTTIQTNTTQKKHNIKQNTTQTKHNSNKTQLKQNTTQTNHNSNKTQFKQNSTQTKQLRSYHGKVSFDS